MGIFDFAVVQIVFDAIPFLVVEVSLFAVQAEIRDK
jgi:hypothetical protein